MNFCHPLDIPANLWYNKTVGNTPTNIKSPLSFEEQKGFTNGKTEKS